MFRTHPLKIIFVNFFIKKSYTEKSSKHINEIRGNYCCDAVIISLNFRFMKNLKEMITATQQ